MKQRILNFILKHLFASVTLDDIVSVDPRTNEIRIDGVLITANELRQMKAEIKALEGFRIWHVISSSTKNKAEEFLFTKAKVIDDMNFGKAMLFNLDLQNSIMKVIKNKNL